MTDCHHCLETETAKTAFWKHPETPKTFNLLSRKVSRYVRPAGLASTPLWKKQWSWAGRGGRAGLASPPCKVEKLNPGLLTSVKESFPQTFITRERDLVDEFVQCLAFLRKPKRTFEETQSVFLRLGFDSHEESQEFPWNQWGCSFFPQNRAQNLRAGKPHWQAFLVVPLH